MESHGKHLAKTYCPYCGVGCGLEVELAGGRPIKIRGDASHPANFGEICAKAAHLIPTIRPPGRALYPMVRETRGKSLERTSWDAALGQVADRFSDIIARYGPEAVAFYGSGQLLTEDYYVFNKLAKGFLRTNNFDTNSRLCMASTVAAYTAAFGIDGPPACYADIELADLFLLVGTNTAWCHPIVFRRIEGRKRQDPAGVKVIVVDPRRTRTAELADLHLPITPGTDVALLNAILAQLVRIEAIDSEFILKHTTGWKALRDLAMAWPLERASAVCGIAPERIAEAAALFGRARQPLSMWSMGANQSSSGTQKNLAVINLHLATGTIGRPGCGPFSLTGQPNAMGGRETGGLAHLLPGYRRIENSGHRAETERHWGLAPGSISATPGLSALDIFDGLASGRIKAVWMVCTNPERLYTDYHFVTADQRARFILTDYQAPAEITGIDYPLILTTGRVRNQWHTMTRTGTAPALLKDAPEPYLEVNPADGKASGLSDGGWAEARSRRGTFIARVHITDAVPIGTCFAPFHWGRRAGEERAVNNLTNRAMDPVSRQPELKFTAINLRPFAPADSIVADPPSANTIAQQIAVEA